MGSDPRPPSLLRSLVKTAAVAILAAGALHTPLLALALALCALGDWLLSRPGEAAFMSGVGAFAAGHLVYAALFLTDPASDPSRLTALPHALVDLLLIAIGLIAALLLNARAGALRGPVLGYIPVILGMGLAALTVPAEGPHALILPAAMAFIASDLILAAEKFLLPPGHPLLKPAPYAIWVLYWTAQAGFFAAFA